MTVKTYRIMEAHKNIPVESVTREDDEPDGKIIDVQPPMELLGYYIAECDGYPWKTWAYRPSETGMDGWQITYDKRKDVEERLRQLRKDNYRAIRAKVVQKDRRDKFVPLQVSYHTDDGLVFAVVAGGARGKKVPIREVTQVRARSVLLSEVAYNVPIAKLDLDPRVNQKWIPKALRRLEK